MVPTLVDGELTLFDSNLILEYLLATYPDHAGDGDPPLAPSITRPEHRWEDAKVLATIDTFAASLVNIRLMAADGVTPETSAYMARQSSRMQHCLDWLEARATERGFIPGWFSIADIALICPLAYGEKRGVLQWRGRKRLEAIYDRALARASVASTPVNDLPLRG